MLKGGDRMSYATPTDYERYGGGMVPPDRLDRALEEASDHIDNITYSRIRQRGFDKLSTFQKDRVIKAVCKQADYTHQYGDYINMPFGGFSAGSISMSLGKDKDGNSGMSETASAVKDLLLPTGLMDRRVRWC